MSLRPHFFHIYHTGKPERWLPLGTQNKLILDKEEEDEDEQEEDEQNEGQACTHAPACF